MHVFTYVRYQASRKAPEGGGLVQWLGLRISDQGVPGSSPGRVPFVVALSKSHLPLA